MDTIESVRDFVAKALTITLVAAISRQQYCL